MLNFYPGPSKIYPAVGEVYKKGVEEGVFEYNHRSDFFAGLYQETDKVLKEKLNIPDDYLISFSSSATECWQQIMQSFVKNNSSHIYSGAFGEKWCDVAELLSLSTYKKELDDEELLDVDALRLPSNTELIAVTHNETSNGTQLSNRLIGELKKKYDDVLIAVDATSSMAGVALSWENGDIWFSSVQKCFGLPSGMAVMVCSPKAVERAKAINNQNYYNSYVRVVKNTEKWQTTHTPNIPSIYLLKEIVKMNEGIEVIDKKIKNRASELYSFFEAQAGFSTLIQNSKVRSDTVLCLELEGELMSSLFEAANEKGIMLGKGYGEYKSTTFRVANFPVIHDEEFDQLKSFINEFTR